MCRYTKILMASMIALVTQGSLAAGSPGVEHNVQSFLNTVEAGGGKPLEQLSPVEARTVLVNLQASTKLTLSPADISKKMIKADGKDISLTIIRPAGVSGVLPVFMFFHGGGWILGDFQTHERFVRDLVAGSGAVAVFVNYTPSPESHYPVAINEAYAATKWVAQHGEEIGVDGKRLAVVGNSVGGNMATVVALMSKEKGAPALRAQILFWPVTNANLENTSYDDFANGHFLTKAMMKWFWDAYTTNAAQRQEIHVSPLLATSEQLKGLPPALVITAEKDVLRDEGEAYARKLDSAGVAVVATRYNGMIHDFGLINTLSQLPATRAAMIQASEELKRQLK